ncbi:HPr family phosphocarrier protein [Beijerinckia sp. L45]|uniref:HPr family phosphocarrier protein n=1 Tax=Beijerinckia sp. L45 TaxID=1641855 RepID=UPI00157513FA|nr:HPr family phosphocarrier protein [Beijerinckia sp. L45]
MDPKAEAAAAGSGQLSRELPIINRKGLHARATAKFVQCAEKFSAAVTVTRNGETVGGTSIMGILTLGAGIGTTILVSADGADAEEALDAIAALIANRFGEDE